MTAVEAVVAVLAAATALMVLATAVVAWRASAAARRTAQQVEAVDTGVREVRMLVDGRMSEVLDRVRQLTAALVDSGVEVPEVPQRQADDPADGPEG